jgi:hypothetical protein
LLCRFGNFIGEAEESENESHHAGHDADAYLDVEPAEEAEINDQQLMEVDGTSGSLVNRPGRKTDERNRGWPFKCGHIARR